MIGYNKPVFKDENKNTRIDSVREGIDFILSHFEGRQQLFPRKISTSFSNNKQFTVHNKEQILNECIKSNFIDCRINAYPVFNDSIDCNLQASNLIFIDIDLDKKLSQKWAKNKLENSMNKCLKIIREKIDGCKPTILWTGNGYHIYIVLDTRPLELIKELNELSQKPSEEFLRYAEMTFSLKKKDSGHYPSFKSSLLRIPYTFNSKNLLANNEIDRKKAEVRIVQKFDNDNVKSISVRLLRDYKLWLADNDLLRKKKEMNSRSPNQGCNIIDKNELAMKYSWIEKLLQTPLPCFRRYCLYRILVPYLVTVRKLNDEECFGILKKWLDKCNDLSKILFDKETEIKARLNGVKSYKPVSLYKLRDENSELYHLILHLI